ncbi:MAG TPA: EAL domain-containing protein [Coleofasciculaceae cyanobacterium]
MTNFLPASNLPSPGQGFSTSSFSADLLNKFFPFYLAFNRELQVIQIGDAMQRLYPKLTIYAGLEQHFWIKYPELAAEFDAVCHQPDTLILLESRHNGLQFQGQVMADASGLLFFLGSPQLTDVHALQSLAESLAAKVIPSRSSTADYLLLLQARATNLSDLRRLADRLTEQRRDWQRALTEAELTLSVFEQSTDAIAITDTQAKILKVNAAFEIATGYSDQELLGQSPDALFKLEPGQGSPQDIWPIAPGQIWHGRVVSTPQTDPACAYEALIFPIHNKLGKLTHSVYQLRKLIDPPRPIRQEEQNSLSLFQATFEATADGILVTNTRGYTLNFNQKFVDLWQIANADRVMQEEPQIFSYISRLVKHPECFSNRIQELYAHPDIESHDILELQDGRFLEGRSRPQRMHNQIIGRVWSLQDITERQRTEARIRYQASHDLLTGLPNRMMFNDRLSKALFQAAQNRSQIAVMFLDLDRFKLINDSLGHAAGDQLLQEVARRLKACLRESDLVARWAGDEFTLLLSNLYGIEDATRIAQKILAALRPDYDLEGRTLHVSSSIGIAVYPTDGEDVKTLLKNADAALYRAKDSGRNGYSLYTSTLNSDAAEWLTLENHLHYALERQELILYYQPQVNVVTGEIVQMEALLRWRHPDLGIVSPGRFIPIAEENGLIVPIGEWVLRTACAQNRAWQSAGLSPVRVAVNLSARQLCEPKLLEMIGRVLQETQLHPRYLELEITETIVMKNVERTCTILNELRHMGVSTAMDDFGTGYSSLGYLKKFPFHTLKIDQSFVRDLNTDPNDKAIVAAIIAMGKVLNLQLVAEGVETNIQKHSLLSLECQVMQGYLFSSPLPVQDATYLLANSVSGQQVSCCKQH